MFCCRQQRSVLRMMGDTYSYRYKYRRSSSRRRVEEGLLSADLLFFTCVANIHASCQRTDVHACVRTGLRLDEFHVDIAWLGTTKTDADRKRRRSRRSRLYKQGRDDDSRPRSASINHGTDWRMRRDYRFLPSIHRIIHSEQ